MARILMAWELGANFGHLSHQLPIARALRRDGHEVLFAVRDTSIAAELLSPEKFPYVQAPRCLRPLRPAKPLMNYSELLLCEGYGIPAVLLGQLAAWTELLRMFRTTVVVADHSPTAILAARVASVAAVAIGSGFGIPPEGDPTPSFRPWMTVSEKRLAHSDAAVVSSVNKAMRRLGGTRDLEKVSDAFEIDARLLMTFPELDHYGPRHGATQYVGPVYGGLNARRVEWSSSGKRVVAYLRNPVPGLRQLLRALAACDAEVICAFPGITRAQAEKASVGNLRVIPHSIDLEHLLPQADLTVTTAGVATTSQSMLAGVPLLLVPSNADQQLLSMRAEQVGVALVADGKRNEAAFAEQLRRLIAAETCLERTREFACAHVEFNPGAAAASAAAVIERVAAGVH
jgi:UDP:flavonoid glycosyltransferase YjiC (YdhE family)